MPSPFQLPSQTGQSGNFLTTNGITAAWSAVSATAAFNVVPKNTTYSASINDFVICSGSSFTITLPTAVGQSGKQIGIIHTGTSLSATYTIATTSSQTIGTITGGSYALNTFNELLIVASDNSNWQILQHRTNNGPTSFSASPGGGWGTVTGSTSIWERNGDMMHIEGMFTTGTTVASLSTIGIPSGATINSSNYGVSNTTANPGPIVGQWVQNGSGSQSGPLLLALGTSSSTIYSNGYTLSATLAPANGSAMAQSTKLVSYIADIYISGWQP